MEVGEIIEIDGHELQRDGFREYSVWYEGTRLGRLIVTAGSMTEDELLHWARGVVRFNVA